MAAAKPRLYTQIPEDMKNFWYRDPILNKHKSKTGYITKSQRDQTRPAYQMVIRDDPKLKSPYGISEPMDAEKKDTDRKSLDLTIESESLQRVLEALDEHNIDMVFQNQRKCLELKMDTKTQQVKEMTREQVAFMYKPLVSHDKTGKGYKPTFRTKINLNKSHPAHTRIYTAETGPDGKTKYTEVDESVVTKGCLVLPIVEISSLWINKTQFGMTLELTEMIVYPTARTAFPFFFDGDDQTGNNNADSNNNTNPFANSDNCRVEGQGVDGGGGGGGGGGGDSAPVMSSSSSSSSSSADVVMTDSSETTNGTAFVPPSDTH